MGRCLLPDSILPSSRTGRWNRDQRRYVWRERVRYVGVPRFTSRWRRPGPPVRLALEAPFAFALALASGAQNGERSPPLLSGLQGPSGLGNRLESCRAGFGRRGLTRREPEPTRKKGG